MGRSLINTQEERSLKVLCTSGLPWLVAVLAWDSGRLASNGCVASDLEVLILLSLPPGYSSGITGNQCFM